MPIDPQSPTKLFDGVLSGSGTLLDSLCGALQAIEEVGEYVPARLAGTSGGSVAACARAHGMSYDDMKRLAKETLASGSLVDISLAPWDRWGFVSGDKIHKLLKATFPGKMSDAELPWCCYAHDLWAQKTVRFSSWETPDMSSADVVRASIAIPIFFKGVYLPVDGNERFLVDGGVSANFAMDAFDDEPDRPTIGVRFRPQGGLKQRTIKLTSADMLWPPRAAKKTVAYLSALSAMLIENNVQAHMSEKNYAREIRIDSEKESGMDFFLSGTDVEERWQMGYIAAQQFFEENE
jgi:predicted acylesterase/phospholipase RssA